MFIKQLTVISMLALISSSGQNFKEFYEIITSALNFTEIHNNVTIFEPHIPDDVLIKMIDASTKIPNGIFAFNTYDLGNFDECYSLVYNDTYGKYCLGTIDILSYFKSRENNPDSRFADGNFSSGFATAGLSSVFHIAICIPSTVSVKDIPVTVIQFTEESCYSKATEPVLSVGSIVTITILSFFGVTAFCSTSYDLYLHHNNKKPLHGTLLAFSFYTNGKKIFHSTQNPDQLLCLNGMKAISMMWVIFGHEYYLFVLNGPMLNPLFFINDWTRNPFNMIVLQAGLSVDTFLTIGGCVTVYTFLKSINQGVKFNLILFYIHRYLRLTPIFIIIILIHLYLVQFMGNGPLWRSVESQLIRPCETGWWMNLLYISNYRLEKCCVPQTWYLNVDMQLYFLSPLVLFPLVKWPRVGLGILGFLIAAACSISFGLTFKYHYGAPLSPDSNLIDYYYYSYIRTYTRFGPYVIGMAAGFFIYNMKTKFSLEAKFMERKKSLVNFTVCLLWIVCLGGLLSSLFAGHALIVRTNKVDEIADATFNALNKPIWAVCIVGVIILCISGYGKPVDAFLSWSVFQILSKLSYSFYLIHYCFIQIRIASFRFPHKFSNQAFMYVFWADFSIIFFLSIIFSLLFESPVIILEKYICKKLKS